MNGLYINRTFGVSLHLFAQIFDVGVNNTVISVEIRAEYQIDEIVPGKYLFRVLDQGGKDLPFTGG